MCTTLGYLPLCIYVYLSMCTYLCVPTYVYHLCVSMCTYLCASLHEYNWQFWIVKVCVREHFDQY